MAKRDYYEILGVDKNATDDEIKSSFRKLAKKYHPDVCKEEGGAEKFKEAQEAYAVLSDKTQRSKYDKFGHAAFEGPSGGGNSAGGYDFSGFDFSSIFDEIFNRNDSFSSFGFEDFMGGGRKKSNRMTKGRDLGYLMEITFEEAVNGCKKEIELEMVEDCPECSGKGGHGEVECPECNGSGYKTSQTNTIFGSFATKTTCQHCAGSGVIYKETCSRCRGKGKVKETKTIMINVPKGIDNKEQLRLSGKGEAGNNGGPNGDLYIEFKIKPHPLFKRDGNNIYIDLPVTICDLVLGSTKTIKTLDGFIDLKIPAGSSASDVLKVKNKGIETDGWKNGDLFVTLKLITPTKLSKEQRKLFEYLSDTDMEKDSEFAKFEKLNK